jgi:hypothetical protein
MLLRVRPCSVCKCTAQHPELVSGARPALAQRMSTDGTWGSHMEIQAAAQLLRCNFTIHQVGQPRWELMGVPNHPVFYHL